MTTRLYTAQLKRLHANSPELAGMTQAAFIRAATTTQLALGLIEHHALEGKDRHEGLEGVVEQAADALQVVSEAGREMAAILNSRTLDGEETSNELEKAIVTLTTYIAITHRVMQKTPASLVAACAKNVEMSNLLPREFVKDVDVQNVGAANG